VKPSSLVLRASLGSALAGFVLGGAQAAWGFLRRPYVLEFQAGEPASLGEKAGAAVQAAAIEGLGWGALGLLVALAAAVPAALSPRGAASLARRFSVSFLLLGAALFGWLGMAWLAEEALPFLAPGEAVLLDLAGIAFLFLGFALFCRLVRFVPRSAADPVATTLAGVLFAGLWLWCAQEVIFERSGGYRSPLRQAAVLGMAIAAVALAALLSRRLERPLARAAARLEAGSFPPRPVLLSLLVLLASSGVVSAPAFRLSALPPSVDYPALESRGEVRGPNVVFVTVDTLRADGLSCYGYPRPTSPFLDSLAAAGTRFADPVSAAAWTKPATGTIFTGLYPSRHGALYHGSSLQLPEGERTVAEAFRAAGYVTAGFVSNPNVKAVFAFDRGFDLFFDSPVEDTVTLACIRETWFGRALMKLLRYQFNWNYENDVRRMNQHVAGWLAKNAQERFFLYVHYIDPHVPYDPPSPWREEFARDHGFVAFEERKRLVGRDLYDAEVRYTDAGIGELVALLEDAGVWENTLFVLTSDHGEEFFEHEVHGHGFSLFQPVVQVPLVLHGPGVPAGRVVEEPVQILDLPATLLELAGLAAAGSAAEGEPFEFGDGRSFAAALGDEGWRSDRVYYLENEFGQGYSDHRAFVFSGARQGRWKLVLTEQNAYFPPQNPDNASEALYDLENDPKEEHNLIADPAHREVIERLLALLQEHGAFLFETGFRDVEPAALTPEIQANLKALGYF